MSDAFGKARMIIEFENKSCVSNLFGQILIYTGYNFQMHYNTKCFEKYVKLKGNLNKCIEIRGKLCLYQENFNGTN
jgi:hypothetical protein